MNIESFLKKDYIINLTKEGKRADNRGFDEHRSLELVKGFVEEKADGSARVKLGNTDVLVGISMDLGEPYPDSPQDGIMSTSAEFRPMADPNFELGPPGAESIELARVVDRGIRESGSIDTGKLFVEEEKVWVVFIDIHVIDNDGNLIDAAGLASIAALLDTRMPKLEEGKIIRGEWEGTLPVTCTPVPLTVAKIAGKLLVDPSLDEEYAMESRLTATTTDTLNAMQKGGVGSFTVDEVKEIVDMSFKKGKEFRKIIEK